MLSAEKERIARMALSEVPAGGSIIIDAGTTTARLAALLPQDIDLTVVTNSIPIAAVLATRPNIQLHLLGGHVRPLTLAMVGSWPDDALRTLSVDVAFLGIKRRHWSTQHVALSSWRTTPNLVAKTLPTLPH
ncbi:MAG: hypothetical protein RLZZ52_668, partial [Actinomycetota bacterium]